jgi:hypothetical protein
MGLLHNGGEDVWQSSMSDDWCGTRGAKDLLVQQRPIGC